MLLMLMLKINLDKILTHRMVSYKTIMVFRKISDINKFYEFFKVDDDFDEVTYQQEVSRSKRLLSTVM